jgi:subtilisin-like proprotein convertase family protein
MISLGICNLSTALTPRPAEGQAQVRATTTPYHSHWSEEAQGRWTQYRLQAPRHLPYVEM